MTTPTTTPPPRQIFLFRHGEKPVDDDAGNPTPPFGIDENGNPDPHSLTPRGWQRSGALTVLFDPAVGPLRDGLAVPSALSSPSAGNPAHTEGRRTYQTISGIGERIPISIDSTYAVGDEAALAAAVLRTTEPVVLICWEHKHIPDIAAAIPTTDASTIPDPWPDDRFDVIWAFTLVATDPTAQYRFDQIPQQLLVGDTDQPITG